MTIETEVSLPQPKGPNKILNSESVRANDTKELNDSNPVKALVICDLDGRGGAVFVQDPMNVEGRFYEDEDDENGKPINPKKPIRLEKDQEVLLWSKKSKGDERELRIYVDDDDGDELPIEPPRVTVKF